MVLHDIMALPSFLYHKKTLFFLENGKKKLSKIFQARSFNSMQECGYEYFIDFSSKSLLKYSKITVICDNLHYFSFQSFYLNIRSIQLLVINIFQKIVKNPF